MLIIILLISNAFLRLAYVLYSLMLFKKDVAKHTPTIMMAVF